ncbi:tripartite tricarboxylate transporter TctB family protein [Rhodospirillum sp. A1_3_36]|uniref:tripartite tricarboxylate transporter TctB family protein n=1 Tax=Rhodospirillum sp. A1_3_36 TaxID=3391666 RepID=UPI0039A4DD69
MSNHAKRRVLGADGFTALGLIAGAVLLAIKASELSTMAGLLPLAMLVMLIGLGALLVIMDARKNARGEDPSRLTETPGRALGAFALIILYCLAVDVIGFYLATLIAVPVIAWVFGYRDKFRLALGTAIFIGLLFGIFSLIMNQDFPVGILFGS